MKEITKTLIPLPLQSTQKEAENSFSGAYAGKLENFVRTPLSRSWQALTIKPASELISKQWIYATVMGPEWILSAAVVDLGYALNTWIVLSDLERRIKLHDRKWFGVPKLSGKVTYDSGEFSGWSKWGNDFLEIQGNAQITMLRCRSQELAFELKLTTSFPALCVPGSAMTMKSAPMKVAGTLRSGSKGTDLRLFQALQNQSDSLRGGIDFTQGYLPHETRWNWLMSHCKLPSGEEFGINLSDANHLDFSENAVFFGDRWYSLPPAEFELRSAHSLPELSRVKSNSFELHSFSESAHHSQLTHLGPLQSQFHHSLGKALLSTLSSDTSPAVSIPFVSESQQMKW